jgi:hypothetical protein
MERLVSKTRQSFASSDAGQACSRGAPSSSRLVKNSSYSMRNQSIHAVQSFPLNSSRHLWIDFRAGAARIAAESAAYFIVS